MHSFSSLIARAAMALALACGAGQAAAGPVYHVSVDTTSLAGRSGWFDFLLLGLDNAAPASATLSHFSGQFEPASLSYGDAAGSLATGVVIGNGAGWNEFAQWARFGGRFGFDVEFALDQAVGAGTTLSVALLDAGFQYLGPAGDVATFALQPGVPDAPYAAAGYASIGPASVPEAPTPWLAAAGILALATARRRR